VAAGQVHRARLVVELGAVLARQLMADRRASHAADRLLAACRPPLRILVAVTISCLRGRIG
jgi:hypothetical protein